MAEEFDLSSVTPISPEGKPYDLSSVTEGPGVLRRYIGDPLVSLAKGGAQLGEAGIGLLDIPSAGRVGNIAEAMGIAPGEWDKKLETLYTPEQQAANKRVMEAKGFFPTISALAENPSVIAHQLLQQVPTQLGMAGLARGAIAGAGKLGAKLAPVAAGAIGEGAVTAGQNLEQVREEEPSGLLTPKQVGLNVLAGGITGLIAGAGGRLAQKAGLVDPETWLAGGLPAGKKPLSLIPRVVGGAVSEGALQEAPQSAQEQILQNLSQEKPWAEGVGQQTALGGVLGGVMGGAFNIPKPRYAGPIEAAAAVAPTAKAAPTTAEVAASGSPGLVRAPDGSLLLPQKTAQEPAKAVPATETPPEARTPLTGPMEAAAGPAEASRAVIPESKPLPTEAMAQRGADFETKRTGEPHVVAPKNGMFVVVPQSAMAEQQAAETKLTEARTAGEAAAKEAGKAAEEAAVVAQTPLAEGGEKIPKNSARAHVDVLNEQIDLMQNQIETLRASTDETDRAFIPKIETQIAQFEKKRDAILKRAGLPKPEVTNAVQESGATAVGAQPGGQGSVGQQAPGVGQGNQGVEAPGAGAAQAEGGRGAVAGGEKALEGGAANVPAAPAEPAAKDLGENKVTQLDYFRQRASTAKAIASEIRQEAAATAENVQLYLDQGRISAEQVKSAIAEGKGNVDDTIDHLHALLGSVEGPIPATQEAKPAANETDLAAHEAATSPTNALLEPTPAQAQAGNYQKGHLSIGPLDIAIENPEGSVRKDKGHPIPEWETEIKQGHYGYIKGTVAPDSTATKKSGLDVMVKPGTPENWDGKVFVVDQVDQKTGAFDEPKSFVGYDTQKEATAAYKANYPKGWKVGKVTGVPLQVFDQWAKSGQTDKAFAERGPVALERMVTVRAVEKGTGREAEVHLPAHEALSRLNADIQRAKDLLTCLSL
jgi:hypothetical protein